MFEDRLGFAFDVDGTLTEPGQRMDDEISLSLLKLSETDCVIAIISGAPLTSIRQQCEPFLDLVSAKNTIKNVLLFTTSGSRCHRFNYDFWGYWEKIYEYGFGAGEALEILKTLYDAIEYIQYYQKRRDFLLKLDLNDLPREWGRIVLDRGSQITFAALGEHSPAEIRMVWDANQWERRRMADFINRRIGSFATTRIGGASSIDINLRDIDKGFAMRQFEKLTGIPFFRTRFVGDGLYRGGNDYPVKEKTDIACYTVASPLETRALINSWL
jgi:HAD superfamily hydrolase (TIGR01484 family)